MQRTVVWVDENDQFQGEISHREAHARGLPHRVVAVYVRNDAGHILVQVRAYGDPLDHSAAEHLQPGEDYAAACARALREELGIEAAAPREIGWCISNENIGEHESVRHLFRVFECSAAPAALGDDRVLSIFWADPLRIWDDMQKASDHDKYCGGFRETLELYLTANGLLPR